MTARWNALLAAVLLGALTGCTVPTGGAVETIPASDVPYGLASPSPTPVATASPDPVAEPGRVYLLDSADVLVPRPRETDGATTEDRLGALLDELAAGPTPEERDQQLSTALPPEVELSVVGLTDGTATVDISDATEAPAGVASRRAVGQIVLSATSIPGVEAVVLTWDGEQVEAPLPSGELTVDPLTAADYEPQLRPAPPS